MNGKPPASMSALVWPKRLLSADDLRRHLTSQGELVLLPNTVITPLAVDELRTKGVRITWQSPTLAPAATKSGGWVYVCEKPDALIDAVVKALERDGPSVSAWDGTMRALAEAVAGRRYPGGICLTADAALVCCIANKIAGIRAAVVMNAAQVPRCKKTLGPNVYVIETPGRTFFELRQMLKAIIADVPPCPEAIAKTLKELDGHAHR